MNILYYISGYDGCGYYRVQLPAKYLNRLKDVHAKISMEYNKSDIEWADIIVLQKQSNPKALPFVNYAKKIGKKLIIENDDDYFSLPAYNPAHVYYKDKKQDLINFYELVHGMTVTNNHLKKTLLQYCQDIEVLPNSLDIPYLENLSTYYDEEKMENLKFFNSDHIELDKNIVLKIMENKITVGWGGSPTHLMDLQQATPALVQLAEENKDVLVVMMACATDAILKQIPKEQLILVNPSPVFLYHKFLSVQKWAFSICPIEDNLFNRSKSNLKYLEFSYHGFPSVCSEVENYALTVNHGLDGLLTKNNDEDWYRHLKSMVDDIYLRSVLRINSRNKVCEKFDISKNYIKWYDYYKKILEKK